MFCAVDCGFAFAVRPTLVSFCRFFLYFHVSVLLSWILDFGIFSLCFEMFMLQEAEVLAECLKSYIVKFL